MSGVDKKTQQAKQQAIEEFREYILPKWNEIKDAMVNAALAGDVKAAEFIASRMVPPIRPTTERISIPNLAAAQTTEERAVAILNALGEGHISVEQFQQLFASLRDLATALKNTELQRDVDLLKRHMGLLPDLT